MGSSDVLRDAAPSEDFFVGIDSDGCAFPTMEVKHKECFIPNIIKYWRLQAVSRYERGLIGDFEKLLPDVHSWKRRTV